MSANKGTYAALILLLFIGIMYWNATNNIPVSTNSDTISHNYFPNLLAVTLIILCLISFVKTLIRKSDTKIAMPNLKIILVTVLLTVLYIASWNMSNYFYLLTFLFILALLTYYRWSLRMKKKIIATNIGIAIVMPLVIYVIFDVAMNIRF
ncbi:tripartite tricarboxylate transporter TctB family protein [Alkalihalobacillus deserti]|uniref:tripartite tricarboxylate transporter TctB family protein n=1 Tax=Alkalihalobacillus deserti TaxID=2879466 RepID=UPI001D140BCA|nr:tripartite tricarboxylate transporter TctB family protein [Alkalihalobacillus deserti]